MADDTEKNDVETNTEQTEQRTDDYDAAAKRLNIEIQSAFGSVEVVR